MPLIAQTYIVGTHNLCFESKITKITSKKVYPLQTLFFFYTKTGYKDVYIPRTCSDGYPAVKVVSQGMLEFLRLHLFSSVGFNMITFKVFICIQFPSASFNRFGYVHEKVNMFKLNITLSSQFK